MTRTVFYGFGAFVGSISGLRTCSWWPDQPANLGWSTAAMVPIDLAKTPMAARANQIPIADIQVDDHILDGGLTGLGPRWPGGQPISSCWLTETYWLSLGANKPPRQAPGVAGDSHDYEWAAIQYWNGELGDRRFIGFHARILSAQGGLAHVQIWTAGTGKIPGQPPVTVAWLDLAQVAHPVDPIATQISIGGQTEGALFLDADTTKSLQIARTKRPAGQGFERVP